MLKHISRWIAVKELVIGISKEISDMSRRVQELAAQININYDEFIGEMRKRGCSEPTAAKIWEGKYEIFTEFKDNDIYLSNLRKVADVLHVKTGMLLSK
jgi:hypothetical protein